MRKIIFVVGASSGFGYGIAEKMALAGHCVYAGARRVDLMQPLADLGVNTMYLDVQDGVGVQRAVDEIIGATGGIDVLYANAGYGCYGTIEETPIEAIKQQFDINVFGLVRAIQAVLPSMRKRRCGRVILTCSVVSHVATLGLGYYAASKHALKAIAVALRQEVQGFNIDVVQIEPGLVNTPFHDTAIPTLKKHTQLLDYQVMMHKYLDYLQRARDTAPNRQSTVNAMYNAGVDAIPKAVYQTTVDAKLMPALGVVPEKAYAKLLKKILT